MTKVIVKLQRPVVTNGNAYDVMSYIVDETDEQVSNPVIESMKKKKVKKLFGDYYKIYYIAEYREGEKVVLIEPTWEEAWV